MCKTGSVCGDMTSVFLRFTHATAGCVVNGVPLGRSTPINSSSCTASEVYPSLRPRRSLFTAYMRNSSYERKRWMTQGIEADTPGRNGEPI